MRRGFEGYRLSDCFSIHRTTPVLSDILRDKFYYLSKNHDDIVENYRQDNDSVGNKNKDKGGASISRESKVSVKTAYAESG
jgi:hypothetical protein